MIGNLGGPFVAEFPPFHCKGSLVSVLLLQLDAMVAINTVQGGLELVARDALCNDGGTWCVV